MSDHALQVSQKHVTLPVTGMTCANCVATVERNLKKVSGVSEAAVNLSSERAAVAFDPQLVGLDDLIGRIRRAGYDVALGEADLLVQGLADDNDARRLEKSLAALEGVLEAGVSFASERARMRYVPTMVTQTELREAVKAAGFKAVESGAEAEDAEAMARQREIAEQRHFLQVGLLFTVPLFLFSMGRDLGLLDGSTWRLGQLADAGAGHPGAVLRRAAVLRRCL